MKIGKYLSVKREPSSGKTCRWIVYGWIVYGTRDPYGTSDPLGIIQWYEAWRQYTFDPAPGTTFNAECLEDLARFLRDNRNIREAPDAD